MTLLEFFVLPVTVIALIIAIVAKNRANRQQEELNRQKEELQRMDISIQYLQKKVKSLEMPPASQDPLEPEDSAPDTTPEPAAVILPVPEPKPAVAEEPGFVPEEPAAVASELLQPNPILTEPAPAEEPEITPEPEIIPAAAEETTTSSREAEPVFQKQPRHPHPRGEFFVGKIILSAVAALLVFIGLVYLAFDEKDGIPDWIRIGSMFAISSIFLGSGLLLGRKKQDAFNLALTACGCISLFISILLTHLWFGYLEEWAAFGLLLAWTILVLWLTRRTNSTLLSMIAHVGQLVSLCVGYSLGLSDDRIIFLLVYQFVSAAVIIVGNLLCYKRSYHVGLLISLGMTVIAGSFMWAKFTPRMGLESFLFNSRLPVWGIALAFYMQFLAATSLSYLLSVSAARMKNPALAALVHVANKILWVASAGVNFCLTTYNVLLPIISGGKPYSEIALLSPERWKCFLIEVIAAFVLWLLHLGATELLRSRVAFPRPLYRISAIVGTAGLTVLQFWFFLYSGSCPTIRINLLLFTVPALILIGYAVLSKDMTLKWMAYVLLGMDFCAMLLGGNNVLIKNLGIFGNLLALLYYVLPLAVLWLDHRNARKTNLLLPPYLLRIVTLLSAEMSLISFCVETPALGSGYHGTDYLFSLNRFLIPIGLSLILLICYLFRFDRPNVLPNVRNITVWTPLRYILLVNECIVLTVIAVFLTRKPQSGTELALLIGLFAVSMALAFCRVKEFLHNRQEGFLAVFAGVKFSALIMCFLYGLLGTVQPHSVYTVECMATALVAIIIGFLIRTKPLRIWGLLLTLCCALKFGIYDKAHDDILPCLSSFILGTLLCASVYGFYSLAEKRAEASFEHRLSVWAPYRVLLLGIEIVILSVNAVSLTKAPASGTEVFLLVLLCAASLSLAFCRIREIIRYPKDIVLSLLLGLKLTVLTMCFLHGLTGATQSNYAFSVECMATALVAIIIGFLIRTKPLRIWGLILTLTCILKLVTYDMAGYSTMTRIFAFIIGGVICFSISAVYTLAEKKLLKDEPDSDAESRKH